MQHLFDHRAGLFRSGDEEGALRTYPHNWYAVDETEQYRRIHKHFLLTRPLISRPGNRYSYSNHGMGMMTLVIPALTGKSYREYAVNDYLRPMGLKGKVRPQKATQDEHDSLAYNRSGNGVTREPLEASGTGLSAGGWTSSAQGLLAITAQLQSRYSYDDINRMGFHWSEGGKLSHNGSIGGGFAELVLFPDDYDSPSGLSLEGYHVAVALNTGNLREDIDVRLNALIDFIVRETARANLRGDVDYWNVAWD